MYAAILTAHPIYREHQLDMLSKIEINSSTIANLRAMDVPAPSTTPPVTSTSATSSATSSRTSAANSHAVGGTQESKQQYKESGSLTTMSSGTQNLDQPQISTPVTSPFPSAMNSVNAPMKSMFSSWGALTK